MFIVKHSIILSHDSESCDIKKIQNKLMWSPTNIQSRVQPTYLQWWFIDLLWLMTHEFYGFTYNHWIHIYISITDKLKTILSRLAVLFIYERHVSEIQCFCILLLYSNIMIHVENNNYTPTYIHPTRYTKRLIINHEICLLKIDNQH